MTILNTENTEFSSIEAWLMDQNSKRENLDINGKKLMNTEQE